MGSALSRHGKKAAGGGPAPGPGPERRLADLLEGTTLDQLREPQECMLLRDTNTVDEALKLLAQRRILSAPVRLSDAPEADGSGATIFGFVDVRDIVSSFFTCAGLGGVDIADMKMLQRMRLLEEKGQDFADMQLKELPIIGGDGDFYHLAQGGVSLKEVVLHGLLAPSPRSAPPPAGAASGAPSAAPSESGGGGAAGGGDGGSTRCGSMRPSASGASLSSATPPMRLCPARLPSASTRSGGRHVPVVHRLALYDDQEAIVSIISQTDIVKFLGINRSQLGPLGDKTVAQLGWSPKQIVAVTPEVSAIEAMALMHEKHISAVAVVDSVGKIIGNFSVSEMRTIMAEHFGALALPVGEFLALEHGTEFVGYRRITDDGVKSTPGHKFATDRVARTRPRTPGEEVGQALVLVKPTTPFVDVVDKIVAHRIHRVYVIDDDEKPVGCATCTDVLRVVLSAATLA